MTTETALIKCDNERIIEALATPNAMDILLAEVREKVDEFEGDTSTAKGRDEIKSFAFKLVKTRTSIDGIGKAQVADITAKVKAYNAQRKACRESLEAMQSEVRAPLDEWERVREEAETLISSILAIPSEIEPDASSADIERAIASAEAIDTSAVIEEKREAVDSAKESTLERLQGKLAAAQLREAEAAELERLRQEAAEREAAAERERIEKAAAEKARKDAEEEAARKVAEAEAKAQREIAEAQAAAEAKVRAEELAKRDAEEKARQAELKKAEKAAAKPAKSKTPEQVAMNAAYTSLLRCGFDTEVAKALVKAIAAGCIDNVTLTV